MRDDSSATGLFRQEMLDARKQRWLGSIRLPVSRMGGSMAALAMAALLALAALLGWGRYTRSEAASGQLVMRDGASSSGPQSMGLQSVGMPSTGMPSMAAPLQAELWVDDRAIGLIAPGTPVVLRYPAFPHALHGVQHGRVVRVEHGGRAHAPAWRVLVDLDRRDFAAPGLRAHMRVQAELRLERRRLYEFLFLPRGLPAPREAGR